MADVKTVMVPFLEGVAGYLEGSLSDRRLGYCGKHRAEHTGKICYLTVIDLALYRLTGNEARRSEAARLALRVADRLGTDPRSGARVFLPGALDHRNAANHAIDSGAAVDCLASALLEAREAFSEGEQRRVEEAVRACASTYLKEAALAKGIPAQRLWAGTGLAAAFALLKEESFRAAALESVSLLVRDGLSDGAIPYFPAAEQAGEHPGQSDITSYYHSRCAGFALYILERVGEEPGGETAAFLEKALDFLLALYGGDGLKRCLNEAKQWYWESSYEVASHSFDVHALVMGARCFGRRDLLAAGARSFRLLDRHRREDGGIDSHRGRGRNFQCRLFWNAHAAWVARVAEAVPLEAPRGEGIPAGGGAGGGERRVIRAFPDGGVVKVETPAYTAVLRGVKKPANISFGAPVGGGCLVYFGTARSGYEDRLAIGKWPSLPPGSYDVLPAAAIPYRMRLKEFLDQNRRDLRFRLYIAWLELTGGRPAFALAYPFRHLLAKFIAWMRGSFALHWDCGPVLSVEGNEVRVRGAPARRGGARLEGAAVERRYRFETDRVEVSDRLHLALGARRVTLALHPLFVDLRIAGDGSWRVGKGRAVIRPEGAPSTFTVDYTIAARRDCPREMTRDGG